MAKRTFENLEWREVVWQRPFEQEQVHELFAHLAVLSPRGPVIWTSRSHGGHVQHYIGADSRYISKIVNTIKVHGNIRIYPVGDHIFAPVNTVRQLTVSHPGLSLNTDVTSATMPARRARLIYVHPEIFGSPIGLHLFRMRRIEFMDNPLSVAPDAKVFTEQPLHWLDEDFVISPEYRSYQQEIQANERAVNKTKVYSPDYEAVRKACDPYLDKIRQSDLSQILAAYKRDNKEGDRLFFALLVKVLDIKKPPKLLYVEPQTNETTRGKYTSRTNTIRIYEGNIPDSCSQRMGVLSHEMWHAYQEMKASYRNGKNHLYIFNNANYIDSKDDYTGYRTQLVENEAFYFGDTVKRIVSDSYS